MTRAEQQQLRMDVVKLVGEMMEAALRGQAAALYANSEDKLDLSQPGVVESLALRYVGLRRIAEVVGSAVADHEERYHRGHA